MTQRTLYVLVGIPGSGKSTWAESQDWINDCAYASTDMWVEYEAKQQGKTYTEVFKDYMPTAVDLMAGQVKLAKELNMDIIWDQTSTTVASRRKKLVMLSEYKAIAVVFCTPKKAELERRLASRPGKDIPASVVNLLIENWEEPTEAEGFAEIWYV